MYTADYVCTAAQNQLLGAVEQTDDDNSEIYLPVHKIQSIKTDISEGGRHVISPVQQRDTPHLQSN